MGKLWQDIKRGAGQLWKDIKSSPREAWNKLKQGYNWARENIPMFKEGVDYLREKVPFAGLVEKGLTKVDQFINNPSVIKAGDAIANKLLLRNETPIEGQRDIIRSAVMPINTAITNLNNRNRFLTPQQ
jgi:hypothetical protein